MHFPPDRLYSPLFQLKMLILSSTERFRQQNAQFPINEISSTAFSFRDKKKKKKKRKKLFFLCKGL